MITEVRHENTRESFEKKSGRMNVDACMIGYIGRMLVARYSLREQSRHI